MAPVADSRFDGMPLTFLICRHARHMWVPKYEDGAVEALPGSGKTIHEVQEVYKCLRCETTLRKVWDYPNFSTYVPRYRYPDGYLIKHIDGAERLTKADADDAYFATRKPRLIRNPEL